MQVRKSFIARTRQVQLVEETPESYTVTRAVLIKNEWQDLSLLTEAGLDFTTAVRRFYAAVAEVRQIEGE